MESQRDQRKLAAILAADMVGYSRQMEADEAGTLARLRAYRLELIDPAIAACKGRIIKTAGDGMLVEFPSVVDAVFCAAAIQRRMAQRNADVAAPLRVELRIGINLGDVIVEDGDLFGDGVNVAARLQEVAAPGGICVSAAVRDQVGERLDVAFDDLGERTVKNITRPIRIYRVALEKAPAAAPAVDAKSGAAARPSLVVLPFVNMSGDPGQDFFADGLTEDIITELSRFRSLLVISRNSSFVHKGKAVKSRDIAREFDVQYVIEGSVRKAGDRVRVTVQLIDADTDRHIWAERYDRKIEDIFAIQDEMTSAIVGTLAGRIEAASHERAERKPTANMAAYEYVLTGKILHHRSTAADNAEALRLLDCALALDPKYAHAHAWKACVLGQKWVHNWCEDREALWIQVVDRLRTALALDDNDSDVHRILAAVHTARNDHDKARYHQERALALNPNNDLILVQHGELLTWHGEPVEGIEWIRRAMRVNPYHPERYWCHLGRAHYTARQYVDAATALHRPAQLDLMHRAFLAAALAQTGDAAAATARVQEMLAGEPAFSIRRLLSTVHYRLERDRDHLREGLRNAGLPE